MIICGIFAKYGIKSADFTTIFQVLIFQGNMLLNSIKKNHNKGEKLSVKS